MKLWDELRSVHEDGREFLDLMQHSSDKRQGLTQRPIVDEEDLSFVSPLHAILRTFDMLLKLIYRLNAAVYMWSYSKFQLGRMHDHLIAAKARARENILAQTGMRVDIPVAEI